jgi:large subunit ribosomal protein L4
MDAPILNAENQQVSTVSLSDRIFGMPVNEALLWEVVRMQLAKRRQGTHAVKNRTLVAGGGRKPWRQKGTGRARAGSRRSPLWRGGGKIFGPTPRDYAYSMPKKKRRAGLRSALASKARDGELIVLDAFNLTAIRTKAFAETLRSLGATSALVVIASRDEVIEKSARNVPWAKVIRVEGLNVYDILKYEKLVLLKGAIDQLQERI